MSEPTEQGDGPAEARDTKGFEPEPTGLKASYEASWAVVIGINNYKHQNELTFAVSDACSVAETLISKLAFAPQDVFLVLDNPTGLSATQRAWLESTKHQLGGFYDTASKQIIEQLLMETIPGRTGPDDRVLVYFAGHGTPRGFPNSARAARPYLVPSDAERGKWSQYVDLNQVIEQADLSSAKHIFYVLDACCCGLAGVRAELASRYEGDLLRHKARQCLTAGTAEQYVADRGYDGHSVFTWHVLRALRATETLGTDEVMSASKLIAEVKERVGKDALSKQTPDGFAVSDHAGGDFVFAGLGLALTVSERAELARLLTGQIGPRLDELLPTEFGAQLWERMRENGTSDAESARELGRARLTLGRIEDALATLGHVSLRDDPDALLARARAQIKRGDLVQASRELLRLEVHREHPHSAWASAAARVAQDPRGKRYALLVGVSAAAKLPESMLSGCRRDVAALETVLRERLRFEVRTLVDVAASAAAIKDALKSYAATHREDTFLFYFCGNGILVNDQGLYVVHDFDPDAPPGLTETDVDDAMRAVPALDKVLITDACYLGPAEVTHQSPEYRFLYAGGRKERTYEIRTEDGSFRGAFTYALEKALCALGNAPLAQLVSHIKSELEPRHLAQTPGYRGDPYERFVREGNLELEIVEISNAWSPGPYSLRRLEEFATWLDREPGGMVPIRLGTARALVARERHAAALGLLEGVTEPEALATRARAAFALGKFARARDLIHTLRVSAPSSVERLAGELDGIEELANARPCGLLVANRSQTMAAWTSEPEPALARLRRALVARCGFAEGDIECHIDLDKRDLLVALTRLGGRAGEQPAFFMFIGPGFEDVELSFCSAGSVISDISASELCAVTDRIPNLKSAIVLTELRPPALAFTAPSRARGLGSSMVVSAPLRARDIGHIEAPQPPDLESLLVAFEAGAHPGFSALDWCARLKDVSVRGDGTAPLFVRDEHFKRAAATMRDIDAGPMRRALALLARLARERGEAPHAWLNIAILHLYLRDHEAATNAVDQAVYQHRAQRQAAGGEPGPVHWPAAHYVRGRIMLDAGRYAEAEGAFAIAIKQYERDPRAYLHRARAIRQLIDANLAREAERSVQRYVELGAPLGLEDELVQRVIAATQAGVR